MKCCYCKSSNYIKKGIRNNKQRYFCKECNRYFLRIYSYKLFVNKDRKIIISYLSKGMSITAISILTGYSKATIVRKIKEFAKSVSRPIYCEFNQVYEVDEMKSFIGKNKPGHYVWITYALNRRTKQVVDFVVGKRNTENLSKVINSVKLLHPKKIVTDKYIVYRSLVSPVLHDTKTYRNNRIERANLTLRQHIKRLSRKTLSYSKSKSMLIATLLLYFHWNSWRIGEGVK